MTYRRFGRALRMSLLGGCVLAAYAGSAAAETSPIRIGVMADMSGAYSADAGPGFVLAVRMAIADFGGSVLGRPIEMLSADDQNKPDVGVPIARRWVEREGVQALVMGSISSISIAVTKIAQEHDTVLLFAGSGSSDLTGKACTRTSFQFAYDTYALPKAVVAPVVASGKDTWFVIGVDYTFGRGLRDEAGHFAEAAGGKLIGSVMHPLNAADFSSYLLQAQASGAKVVALANGGADWTNAVKQAHEFGLTQHGQTLVSLATDSVEVSAAGLETAQGMLLATPFYANRDAASRAWSVRFMAQFNGVAPDFQQAAAYSATTAYLKAVQAAGSDAGEKVAATLHAATIDDFEMQGVPVRADGQVMRPLYLARVKAPAESHDSTDIYDIIGTIPPETAWRPMSEGGCPLVQ